MKLTKEKQEKIYAGSVSAAMLGCIIRGISLLVDIGKSLGTSIRRASDNRPCDY